MMNLYSRIRNVDSDKLIHTITELGKRYYDNDNYKVAIYYDIPPFPLNSVCDKEGVYLIDDILDIDNNFNDKSLINNDDIGPNTQLLCYVLHWGGYTKYNHEGLDIYIKPKANPAVGYILDEIFQINDIDIVLEHLDTYSLDIAKFLIGYSI